MKILTNKDLVKIIYAIGRDLWNLSQAIENKQYNILMKSISKGDMVVEISSNNIIDQENCVGFYVCGINNNHKILRLIDNKEVTWQNSVFVKIPIKLLYKQTND
jgi:hypothetical protein